MNTKSYFNLHRKGALWIDEETNELYVWHEEPEDVFTSQSDGHCAWIVDIISDDEVIVTADVSKESEKVI